MADVFDRSVAVVKRYDGTVDKFTGDGIMAVFGAPIALEDHALRACMAALELQAEDGEGCVRGGRPRRRRAATAYRSELRPGDRGRNRFEPARATRAIGQQVGSRSGWSRPRRRAG